MLGEDLGEPCSMNEVVSHEWHERRVAMTGRADLTHGNEGGCQSAGHRLEHPVRLGARAVDLVDEDQGRDVESLQGAKQQRRLRLDAFDCGDNQDGSVEHAEDAFDLRDEVRVAGRVDEIDREITNLERGDGGTDRDAAFAFELERVGLGGAGVDAADVVDGACGVEKALGECCLTRVYVGEDAEIERAHGTSCRARR